MSKLDSSDEQTEVGVYCELDTVFDTRLATLYQVLPELVPKVLSQGYLSRQRDEFPPISEEQFSFLYNNRDGDTLSHAVPTVAVRMIREMCVKLLKEAALSPLIKNTSLTINIHPYKLTNDEIKYLIASFADSMDGYIDVRVIDMSPQELTPMYCNRHFGGMFMYNCSAWLDAHAKTEAFKNYPMTGITLFVPMIRFGPKPTDEQLNLLKQTSYNEFRLFEIQASPFITVNCLNTAIFCADLEKIAKPPKQDQPSQTV